MFNSVYLYHDISPSDLKGHEQADQTSALTNEADPRDPKVFQTCQDEGVAILLFYSKNHPRSHKLHRDAKNPGGRRQLNPFQLSPSIVHKLRSLKQKGEDRRSE